MKIYLSHSSGYDYETELYAPLKSSGIVVTNQILFPHDKENIDINSKNLVQQSDLVIADVSYPSTGQGIELGWANGNEVPILCIFKAGTTPSKSLRFIAKEYLEYFDQNDMLKKLEDWLVVK